MAMALAMALDFSHTDNKIVFKVLAFIVGSVLLVMRIQAVALIVVSVPKNAVYRIGWKMLRVV